MTFKYFSGCSGVGGFEIGIEYAALKAGVAPECVGYSEIDKHAIATYKEHYPDHINYGDLTALDPATLPDFDCLVGGFPCQAFSIGGHRRGFEDTRGTLFFDFARILDAKRPRYFVLENVKGLLSHDGGRTFKTIIATLAELGYDVEWQVLNSKNFGVPQNRERVYIVGHYGGIGGLPVFPFTGTSDGDSGALGRAAADSSAALSEVTKGVADAHRIYHPTMSRTLKALGGGLGALTGLYVDPFNSAVPVVRNKRDGVIEYGERLISNCVDASYHKGFDYHGQRTGLAFFATRDNRSGQLVYAEKSAANTILANYQTGMDNRSQRTAVAELSRDELLLHVRKLTPTETERLQGFPDGWTIGSDTQRYRQCGNAVTTNVVEAIFDRLFSL